MRIKSIAFTALGVAFISVLAQIAIPMPWGVPFTLQMLAVAFVGFMLPVKYSFVTAIVYILLGAVGAPVFSSFGAGVVRLASPTGGFIFGFIPFVVLCSLAVNKSGAMRYSFIALGLVLCHAVGVIWFSVVSAQDLWASFVCASLPYLVKDIVCIIVGLRCAEKLKKVYKLDM